MKQQAEISHLFYRYFLCVLCILHTTLSFDYALYVQCCVHSTVHYTFQNTVLCILYSTVYIELYCIVKSMIHNFGESRENHFTRASFI